MCRYRTPSHGCSVRYLAHGIGIADALAEMLVCRVIREPSELVLDGLRKRRICDNGILGFLVREVRIKIGHIQNGFLKLATTQ